MPVAAAAPSASASTGATRVREDGRWAAYCMCTPPWGASPPEGRSAQVTLVCESWRREALDILYRGASAEWELGHRARIPGCWTGCLERLRRLVRHSPAGCR